MQDPAESSLETKNSRFIVILNQVGPGDIGGEVVVGLHGEKLHKKSALNQIHVGPLRSESEKQVAAGFQREFELQISSRPVVEISKVRLKINYPRSLGGCFNGYAIAGELIGSCRNGDFPADGKGYGNRSNWGETLNSNKSPELNSTSKGEMSTLQLSTRLFRSVITSGNAWKVNCRMPAFSGRGLNISIPFVLRMPVLGTNPRAGLKFSPICFQPMTCIPAIVGVIEGKSSRIIRGVAEFIVRAEKVKAEAEVFISLETGSRKARVGAYQSILSRADGIAARENASDIGLPPEIAADSRRETDFGL